MYYGEFETDRYIRETFFKDKNYGVMIEVGAGPTEMYSMSKHFRDSGWRCILIEPNPKFVDAHKKINNEIYQLACADYIGKSNFKILNNILDSEIDGIRDSALSFRYSPNLKNVSIVDIIVNVVTLNHLLDELSVVRVDFVSIDTEGWELEVMKGFSTEKYQPQIVVLENYTHMPEYEKYMKTINYTLVNKIKYNYIFERN